MTDKIVTPATEASETSPLANGQRRLSRDPLDRFRSRYEIHPNGCWIWQGTGRDGYGQFTVRQRRMKAHRFSYETFVGRIPDGLEIDHLCQNRACVNWRHLEAVTHRENLLRGQSPTSLAMQTNRCGRGHEFDERNTRIDKAGGRRCRACDRAYAKRQRVQRKVGREKTKNDLIAVLRLQVQEQEKVIAELREDAGRALAFMASEKDGAWERGVDIILRMIGKPTLADLKIDAVDIRDVIQAPNAVFHPGSPEYLAWRESRRA